MYKFSMSNWEGGSIFVSTIQSFERISDVTSDESSLYFL